MFSIFNEKNAWKLRMSKEQQCRYHKFKQVGWSTNLPSDLPYTLRIICLSLNYYSIKK